MLQVRLAIFLFVRINLGLWLIIFLLLYWLHSIILFAFCKLVPSWSSSEMSTAIYANYPEQARQKSRGPPGNKVGWASLATWGILTNQLAANTHVIARKALNQLGRHLEY